MLRLAGARELLDGPLDERTLAGNLRDLRRLNSWLGGAGLSWRAIEPLLRASRGRPMTLLDIGTGAADIPAILHRAAVRRNLDLRITATDVRPEIVAIAQETVRETGIAVKLAAPGRIDAPDGSFDVVHSSMLMHHLDPAEAVALLAEMRRVARQAVVVNDLDRQRIWLALARILTRVLTRNAYTRNDAPLSVQRSYRPPELLGLAAAAGLQEEVRYRTRPPYRYAVVLRLA